MLGKARMPVFIGMMLVISFPAIAADYYSVALDVPSKTITETAWQESQPQTEWAPKTLTQLVTRGVGLVLPTGELAPQQSWEMDLGILQDDGNIVHLLGTASVSEMTPKFAIITADLSGVQLNNCSARLSATVEVATRSVRVEKLAFNCLGREVVVATARHHKE